MKKSLTICIPLFNEEEGVHNLYKELINEIENIQEYVDLKIILVNDGSTDSTQTLLEKFFKENIFEIVAHKNNLNLDGFLKTSLSLCNTDYIAFLDSDCTYSPKIISEMLNYLDENLDVISASPWHPQGSVVGLSKSRVFISKSANFVYRTIMNKKIYTSSSILKIYKYETIKDIQIKSKGFVAITELYCKTLLKKSMFLEFPCKLNIRIFGSSKIQFTATVISHLKFMLHLILFRIKFKN